MTTFLVLFITIVFTIILFPICIAILLPLMTLSLCLQAKCRGRYLNRYFIVSRRKDGTYVLHFLPYLGYYNLGKIQFRRFLLDAIQKFEAGYPDTILVAQTLLFQSVTRAEEGKIVPGSRLFIIGHRLMMDFLILRNIAHYRKKNGRWVFADYIRDVHQKVPMEYPITGRK
ncbi:hypothetical protein L1N85_24595 [Paenibacillus alkaliterrae]|uniref:hypothetical protein n=1 Tax=Paenibacillus alkaliterrae TaxID=320909 RepID=UPI001F3BE754|nr:hypothetical protein [Paenibacillus alkaliterrae]MCF2941521.1 hypothetical protein [Paenibacillus alkaliterrae]